MKSKAAQGTISNAFEGIIGVSTKIITPKVGIYTRNWGAGDSQYSEGVHRPLELNCLTLQENEHSAPTIIISADLGWWKTPDEEAYIRTGVRKHFNIELPNLMFCLSHTHSGPSLSLADSQKKGGELIKPYLDFLLEASIAAIQTALDTSFSGRLDWRYGSCDLATNRDFYCGEENRYLTGFNPEITGDNTLLVGRVTDMESRVKFLIVNYACHPTTLAWDNHLISPDYIGAMREVIKDSVGVDLMFLQGASGDQAPAIQYVGDVDVADNYGRQLGYSVLSTIYQFIDVSKSLAFQGSVESGASLAIWGLTDVAISTTLIPQIIYVKLPVRDLPSELELQSLWTKSSDSVEKERLWRKIGLRRILGDNDSFELPVWIWKVGETIIVGQCTEAYVHFQKQIRDAFFPTPVVVINIVNGYIGYLPTKELYQSDAYSVWQTPFEAGSLEKLESGVVRAIVNLNNNE
ncbi:hypothetical protein GQF61_02360 [Sphingobacterium sp. DK4209]|uniref:Neutral/alkaline non-lysosomal ceramidase N-terminal domain-containing protein n=1 Tax=Sphingobacterium zhuxiongii TaxID=2662364 RepID=A0A5Q0QCT4_9SPHI|nr:MULTISPECIES: hypothetical protein [unclassified Sphingobacterium]MVZ64681.1 hypothetical protein [Sphingobacterium sp. DK4209]QGA27019.1 hypothetical protein GFH32_12115 [Sphingobacterium sp. dk4302]